MIAVSKLLRSKGVAHALVTSKVSVEIRRERDGKVFFTMNGDSKPSAAVLDEVTNEAKKVEKALGEPVFVHMLGTDFVLKNGALVPAKHHARNYADTNRQKREDF
jgi:hypothetical protein